MAADPANAAFIRREAFQTQKLVAKLVGLTAGGILGGDIDVAMTAASAAIDNNF